MASRFFNSTVNKHRHGKAMGRTQEENEAVLSEFLGKYFQPRTLSLDKQHVRVL